MVSFLSDKLNPTSCSFFTVPHLISINFLGKKASLRTETFGSTTYGLNETRTRARSAVRCVEGRGCIEYHGPLSYFVWKRSERESKPTEMTRVPRTHFVDFFPAPLS